jgi:DNA-binding GntR family transcriptional regulator
MDITREQGKGAGKKPHMRESQQRSRYRPSNSGLAVVKGCRNREPVNAQESAYGFLKSSILSGKIRAGTTIRPAAVGRSLGISRIPVREAILQLESQGLISIAQNGRPTVPSLSVKDIFELFDMRVALETLAIRRATPRLRAGVFAQLEADLEKMERPGSGKRWLALHDAFHNRIYAEADMPRLLEEIKRLRQSIYPYLLMYIDLRKDPEIPGHEHKTLLNVLKNRNPNEAARALAEHIRKGASTLVYEQLGSEDAFFDDENVS